VSSSRPSGAGVSGSASRAARRNSASRVTIVRVRSGSSAASARTELSVLNRKCGLTWATSTRWRASTASRSAASLARSAAPARRSASTPSTTVPHASSNQTCVARPRATNPARAAATGPRSDVTQCSTNHGPAPESASASPRAATAPGRSRGSGRRATAGASAALTAAPVSAHRVVRRRAVPSARPVPPRCSQVPTANASHAPPCQHQNAGSCQNGTSAIAPPARTGRAAESARSPPAVVDPAGGGANASATRREGGIVVGMSRQGGVAACGTPGRPCAGACLRLSALKLFRGIRGSGSVAGRPPATLSNPAAPQ